MDWVNTIVQGALVGGLYALFAAGLSLMFGVMRLVNIAHGDLIVLAAYLALVVVETLGLTPFVSLVVVVPAMFLLGYILQRGLLNFTLGGDILPPLLVTFGLSIIIQNALLEGFSADSQKLSMGSFETASIQVTDQLAIGWFPATIFVTAVVVIALLELLLYNTAIGRAFRATSDDADTARLYGVRNRHIFSLATALALAVISIAAIFLAVRTTFGPASGPARLLFAFEAVIIGGLGSLWGTLAGGVVLGVAQSIGAQLNPGWETLAGHVAFLVVLIIRPRGLFPKLVD
ncbi:MAG TPA: branched-chain amino acid ABC transporter permease [Stellaceae bacterium]|jgi:branched-chain amino acid transport system permease protein|nr:branched-chain amino acid ABC transporter permease [Stellaceae bacterium]